jgi:hypothetical protein
MGSDFLFAMPSLLTGISRTLDLGATFDSYNESLNESIADTRALCADWAAVGQSLAQAIDGTLCGEKAAERYGTLCGKGAAELVSDLVEK